jgi:3-hydroxy-3-methylglutaryl CoA synthase
MLLARKLGNLGNGSVFGSLASVLASAKAEELQGKRVGVFTHGGGTAVFFSLRITGNTAVINKRLDLEERLANMKVVPLRPPVNTEVAQVGPCVHADFVSSMA